MARVPRAERYALHCIRRGAAQTILKQGGTLADVLRACGWRSASFKLYLDMRDVEATAMLEILHALDDEPASTGDNLI